MFISDITPGGLSFVFANESNEEYLYGSDYAVFVQVNNSWIPVEPIIDNWGFNDEGYPLMPQSKTTVTTVDWRWLYGELTSGTYKFQKSMLFVREPGNFEKYILEKEFSLVID